MRVLLTSDAVGGVWTYSLELADALAEQGVEVTLAVMGAPLSGDQRAELRESRVERWYAEPFALEWMPDPWVDLERAGDWLLGIREEVQPDLVHLNAYAHAGLPWNAPVLVAAHSCVLAWHEAVHGAPAGPEWDRYAELVRRNLAAADLIVTATLAMQRELERHYATPVPFLVVPNGRRSRLVRTRRSR
jgi:hypothetical protein